MPPKLADHTKIAFIQENPKRAGTQAYERYEKYKAAKTAGEAMNLGAARADITFDIKAGHCTRLGEDESAVGLESHKKECEGAAMGGQKRGVSDVGGAPTQAAAKRCAIANVEVEAKPPVPKEVPVKEAAPGPSACVPAAVQAVPTPNSVSASDAKPNDNVDLSFAKLDRKPIKYIKRTMGEARKLLNQQGLADAKTGGYHFTLIDRQNLAKWGVQLKDLNPDGNLAKDLARHSLDSSIDIEISLPDEFPLAPPFVRVVYPHLSGGFVFAHGGICFELLTAKGWVPSMTLPALAMAIKGIFDYGDVRVHGPGNRSTRTVSQFTEEGARKDAHQISSVHRDGESTTYGSLNRYKS